MTIKRFEDIQSWKEARELTRRIFEITSKGAFARAYGLRNQIERSATSIMANIAEGFGRRTDREFINFLGIANGSTLEVMSHLYVALDANYIDQQTFDILYKQCRETSRMIGGFIKYLAPRHGKTRD
jgi:four helix bundle protein